MLKLHSLFILAGFFNDDGAHHFAVKLSSFGIEMDYYPLSHFVMRLKVDFIYTNKGKPIFFKKILFLLIYWFRYLVQKNYSLWLIYHFRLNNLETTEYPSGGVVEWFKALVLKARFCFSYTSVLEDNLTCSSGSVPKNLTIFWYN